MAVGVDFPESNLLLRAPTPEDEAAKTVYSLPVFRYKDLDGNYHTISKWRLTPEELAEVRRTGAVWFTCWGPTHPPICILGCEPEELKK